MKLLFEKYTEGTCTPEEYETITAYLQDPQNDFIMNGLMRSEWKKIPAGNSLIRHDMELLHSIHHSIALGESDQVSKLKTWRIALAAASVFLALVVAGTFYFMPEPMPEPSLVNVSVPHGGRTDFMLPDGSHVWLNAGSVLTYPDRFSSTREVELKGEAYFDVVASEVPFSVKTHWGEVNVHGTEFNVRSYADETLELTLVEGSVVFKNLYGKTATLVPGKQVLYDSHIFKMRQVDTELYTCWKDGKMIFREEPLKNIVIRMERWYNMKVELKGENLQNLKYTCTIEMETFSDVLELIKVTTPIKYSLDKDTRVLTITSN